MLIYFEIYFFLYLISIINIDIEKNFKRILYFFLFVFFLFFLSGKLNVGGDYVSYLNWYNRIDGNYAYDPKLLFNTLIYVLKLFNLDYFYLHLLCSFIFLFGVFKFLNLAEEKLLLLIILVPFVIYIVGIGYLRQSMAIGFILLGIYFWYYDKIGKYLIFTILATLVHFSSIIFLLLNFSLIKSKIPNKKIFYLIIISLIIFLIFFEIYFEDALIFLNKIGADYKGIDNSIYKYLKFAVHLIPLILFIFFFNQFKKDKKLFDLFFFNFIFFIIIFVLLIYFTYRIPEMTYIPVIAERVLIPFLIIESLILVKFYYFFVVNKFIFKLLLLNYYLLQLYIWMEFAKNSHAWKPYKNIFLEW